MQASIYLPSTSFLSLPSTKASSFSKTLLHTTTLTKRQLRQTSSSLSNSIKAAPSDNNSQFDYSSMASSVFPAEACETLGGDACDVEMFPETKIKQQPDPKLDPPTSEQVDREYLEYNSPNTVFIAEACDDLGGEFCDPAYQSGV
ncbi:unnamed protein product [Lactuca saligna]|uniref:Light-regulated protein n=1 Tax=Lactuca saligna TaxID=75948 RepID=A0AA36E024_LACSI|nr:unnamed protein product [Lactuca saligna]